MEVFLRGSHTTNFVTCGFSKSYNQAAEVHSSNVTCKSPRSPSINCRTMLALVSITHSITIFPAAFLTAIEMLSLCTSIPIYFLLSIERALLSEVGSSRHSKPTPTGAPFYIASRNRKRGKCTLPGPWHCECNRDVSPTQRPLYPDMRTS